MDNSAGTICGFHEQILDEYGICPTCSDEGAYFAPEQEETRIFCPHNGGDTFWWQACDACRGL